MKVKRGKPDEDRKPELKSPTESVAPRYSLAADRQVRKWIALFHFGALLAAFRRVDQEARQFLLLRPASILQEISLCVSGRP